jgi:hypothetical protein
LEQLWSQSPEEILLDCKVLYHIWDQYAERIIDSDIKMDSDLDSDCYIDCYLKSRPDRDFHFISSSNYPYSIFHAEIRKEYLDFTAKPLPFDASAHTTIMERILTHAASFGPETDFRIQARQNRQKALWDIIKKLSESNFIYAAASGGNHPSHDVSVHDVSSNLKHLRYATYLVLRRECLLFICSMQDSGLSPYQAVRSGYRSEPLTRPSDYCTPTSFQIVMHEHLLWRSLEGHLK